MSPWYDIPKPPPVCCQQPQWAYQGLPICGSGWQCLEEVLSLGQFGPSSHGTILHCWGTRQTPGDDRQGTEGLSPGGQADLKSRPNGEPGADARCAGSGMWYPVPECKANAGTCCALAGAVPGARACAWCAVPSTHCLCAMPWRWYQYWCHRLCCARVPYLPCHASAGCQLPYA